MRIVFSKLREHNVNATWRRQKSSEHSLDHSHTALVAEEVIGWDVYQIFFCPSKEGSYCS